MNRNGVKIKYVYEQNQSNNQNISMDRNKAKIKYVYEQNLSKK